jgi:hypothetical protein
MGKKVELNGFFEYRFIGTAGHWSYRLNGNELDIVITDALEAHGMARKEPDSLNGHPHYSVGKIKITIEQVED